MWLSKKSGYVSLLVAMAAFLILSPTAHAATAVSLGTTAPFAVLAGTLVSNVPTSTITGNIGLSPDTGAGITGFTQVGSTCPEVNGTIYTVDAAGPLCRSVNPSLLTTAKADLVAAYGAAAGQTPATPIAGGLLTGTLTPGIYSLSAPVSNLVTSVTLDGGGNPNAVFIFQASSSLITSPGSSVVLTGSAQACNVFWQVTSSATLDTTTSFVGTIMALTSITMNTGATLQGRALARNGAVSLQSNTITVPTCTTAAGSSATTPGLPNAGSSPQATSLLWWSVPAALFLVSSGIYMIRKNRKFSPHR